MWAMLKRLLTRSKTMNLLLGDVVFETPALKGQTKKSFLQWRVKRSLDGKIYFLSLKLKADASAGMQGSPNNYLQMSLASAEAARRYLDLCIAEAKRLANEKSATRGPEG